MTGRIFYLMGKSASGKDTVFRRLMKNEGIPFQTLIPYTTRPIRSGEKNGVDYFFTDEAELDRIRGQGKLLELRTYQTAHGPWHYFTVDDGQMDLRCGHYLLTGTLESYRSLQGVFGADSLAPILLEVEDGLRLQRALDRERVQEIPKYAELCRRFLADEQDFSEEKIRLAGIRRRFRNEDLEECLREIQEYVAALW